MSHTQEVPARTLVWEHSSFEGRRQGSPSSPSEESRLRWWGVNYGAYASTDDAKWLRNPVIGHVPIRVYGPLMDRFFWDSTLQQYTQTEAQVGACLLWCFTGNPTASELDLTENMALMRSRMAGATLFASFVVLELPAERAE